MKKFIKRLLISSIVLFVIISGFKIAMAFSPSLSESVYEVLDEIGIQSRWDWRDVEALEPVTILSYDEENKILRFTADENADYYDIYYTYRDDDSHYYVCPGEDVVEASTVVDGVVIVNLKEFRPPIVITGDIIFFEIIAKGDLINYNDSAKASYTYTVQNRSEKYYAMIYTQLNECADDYGTGRIGPVKSIDYFNYIEDQLYIDGVFVTHNQDIRFSMVYDLSNVSMSDDNLDDVLGFYRFIRGYSIEDTKSLYEVDEEYVTFTQSLVEEAYDFSNVLEKNSDSFEALVNQGFDIEMSQEYYYNFIQGVDKVSFSVAGIYKATNQMEEIKTIKTVFMIELEKRDGYETLQDYINVIDSYIDVTLTELEYIEADTMLMQYIYNMSDLFLEGCEEFLGLY